MEYVDIHTYVILDVMFILYIVVNDIWNIPSVDSFGLQESELPDDPGGIKDCTTP